MTLYLFQIFSDLWPTIFIAVDVSTPVRNADGVIRSASMSNDWDLEMLIKKAQEAAKKPVVYKSLNRLSGL